MNEVMDFSTAYPDILLLCASESPGTATIAEQITDILESCGFNVCPVKIEDARPELLLDFYQLIILIDSSPECPNAVSFLRKSLRRERPDLAHLAFGVLNLSSDEESISLKVANLLSHTLERLGAVELVDVHQVKGHVTTEHITAAQYWSLDCVAAFSEAFAPAEAVEY